MATLSIVNAALTSRPNTSWIIQECCTSREVPNGDGSLHARNVSPIFDNNRAAGWVTAANKLNNPMQIPVDHGGQHTDGISGAQTPMH